MRRRFRDPSGSNARWTDAEIYDAINTAMDSWTSRVQFPVYYDIDFSSGTFEYTLPVYADTRYMDVQSKHTVWGLNAENEEDWQLIYEDVPKWYTYPNSTGGQTLHIESALSSTDGRIIFWLPNGHVPQDIPTVNTEIDSDDTSLVLDTVMLDIGRVGYIKVDDEWIAYAGYTDDGSNTTLTNLLRGLDGTTAATHTAATDVEWGIAIPDNSLRDVLWRQVGTYLHTLFLADGSSRSTETHERIWGMHQQMVDNFWKGWVPTRSPKMVLSRRAVTEISVI